MAFLPEMPFFFGEDNSSAHHGHLLHLTKMFALMTSASNSFEVQSRSSSIYEKYKHSTKKCKCSPKEG
jgi:hypothetical protein